MKRALIYSMVCMLLGGMFTSCEDTPKQKPLLKATSRPYDLLVVVEKAFYQGCLGDSVRAVFEAPTPALPQLEPLFHLVQLAPKDFQRQFRGYSNVLRVRVDESKTGATIGKAVNVYAKPQLVVEVVAPTVAAAASFVTAHQKRLTDWFVEAELRRESARLKAEYSKRFQIDAQQVTGHSFCVPKELKLTKKGHAFVWGSTGSGKYDMNACIYAVSESPETAWSVARFKTRRDSIMQKNVPGPLPGSWMTTCLEEPMLPVFRTIDGERVLEVRGLWEMKGAAMGGPFISMCRYDSVRHQTVTSEVFLYAPSVQTKRSVMRRLEAALWTFR